MGIGETIVKSISEQGLKKCAVAERAGIRPSRFSKIIHNKSEADAKEIMSICNVLRVTPNYLFGVVETKENGESIDRGI